MPSTQRLCTAATSGHQSTPRTPYVVADPAGNVIYTRNPGIAKLDQDGNRMFVFPFGDIVAVDAHGMIYVAGMFASPIELGRRTLTPSGARDIAIVKLAPDGTVLSVQQGLCGAHILPGGGRIHSLAIARDGRITISGASFGTVVLDARGELVLQNLG